MEAFPKPPTWALSLCGSQEEGDTFPSPKATILEGLPFVPSCFSSQQDATEPLCAQLRCNCYREEQNLTTYWIWFFNFNLCFLLLLFTKRILSLHNGLPQETLPLCLNVKPKCLCSEKHSDLAHLGIAARKKKLTHTQPKAGHSRRYMQE